MAKVQNYILAYNTAFTDSYNALTAPNKSPNCPRTFQSSIQRQTSTNEANHTTQITQPAHMKSFHSLVIEKDVCFAHSCNLSLSRNLYTIILQYVIVQCFFSLSSQNIPA